VLINLLLLLLLLLLTGATGSDLTGVWVSVSTFRREILRSAPPDKELLYLFHVFSMNNLLLLSSSSGPGPTPIPCVERKRQRAWESRREMPPFFS
jgi:hypothetical protein